MDTERRNHYTKAYSQNMPSKIFPLIWYKLRNKSATGDFWKFSWSSRIQSTISLPVGQCWQEGWGCWGRERTLWQCCRSLCVWKHHHHHAHVVLYMLLANTLTWDSAATTHLGAHHNLNPYNACARTHKWVCAHLCACYLCPCVLGVMWCTNYCEFVCVCWVTGILANYHRPTDRPSDQQSDL